ncbi:OmpA family protein [Gelidibacter salicanalis]|uniref:OmpA family protein n=1 Tax=Gelidibacter salicanalis TaxID=291193 RepID=A0A5C7AJV0_9FLAO|nr:OmpA family protein [Gelidibacter salicanalis]TXE06895.1 OmpA family protein [Gelidibacter salicanalis]
MKTSLTFKYLLSITLLGFIFIPTANAQVWKRIQKSAERTVERKLEQKTEKETGKMMDSILDPKDTSSKKPTPNKPTHGPTSDDSSSQPNASTASQQKNVSDDLKVYSKFDFVPGDKILFYDDFSQDFVGDFPSKWNTNGTGEVVKINNVEGNWFELKSGHNVFYVPDLKNLPEDYTIEFDVVTQGLDKDTSSSAYLKLILSDSDKLTASTANYIQSSFSLCQYYSYGIRSTNFFKGKPGGITSNATADIRKDLLNQPHISIAVTKNRYRLWVNEKKYLDIPRMIEELNFLNHIKLSVLYTKDSKERIFISNLRVAEGGEDLRRKLISDGRISTNGILFNSGSSKIKPQSLGIILQISQVLQQDENMKLNIVGHTDSDGNSDANLKLSKERALAVKDALINLYNIPENRLQSDGKGANSPVADNSTPDGKAQNRRVEFITL